jgi:hypothetical protein
MSPLICLCLFRQINRILWGEKPTVDEANEQASFLISHNTQPLSDLRVSKPQIGVVNNMSANER